LYLKMGQYDSAKKLYDLVNMSLSAEQRPIIEAKLTQLEALKRDKAGDKQGAYQKFHELFTKYAPYVTSSGSDKDVAELRSRYEKLREELGIRDTQPKPAIVPVPP